MLLYLLCPLDGAQDFHISAGDDHGVRWGDPLSCIGIFIYFPLLLL